MRSCGLIIKRAQGGKRIIAEGAEDGMDHACCIVVFLAQASYRSVAYRQHVDARVMALISSANADLRRFAGTPRLLALTSPVSSVAPLRAVVVVPSAAQPASMGKGHARPDRSG